MSGEEVCGQDKLHPKIKLASPFLAKTPEYVHFGSICCPLLVKHPLRLQLEFPLGIMVKIRSGVHRLSICHSSHPADHGFNSNPTDFFRAIPST